MEGITALIRLPGLQVDWQTLLTVNLPILVAVIIAVPAALVGYTLGAEFLVKRLPKRSQPSVRPWVWVGPAILIVGLILVYPMVGTIIRSFFDRGGSKFVGLDNFVRMLTDNGVLIALRNNVYWLVLYTGLVLVFGLLLAVLSDRVRYEKPVKSLIFMPMAISFVAMAIIWQFVYYYKDPSEPQTGTLNAILVNIFHGQPITWIQDTRFNNFALILIGVWGATGFAMVILSAALKGIPGELLEAARVDGATELTIFRRIILPLMMPTIVVVGTTMVIFALKAFDVVYVMTAGNYNTDILARRMYSELYNAGNNANASALAVILLLAVVPVLIFNLRQFRAVEARR
ncbi:MAG: sugar ABC transporter permease [Chloroflexi bacterium]|nr:MAG: sugar ABC transporter permease [Chloroflexota bacterium]